MKYLLVLLLLSTPVFADPICITDDDDYDRLYRLNSVNADKINVLETDMARVKRTLDLDKPIKLRPKPVEVEPQPVPEAFRRPYKPPPAAPPYDGPKHD